MEEKTEIDFPAKISDILVIPRGDVQYRAAFGGRGSGKSFSFALMAAVHGYAEPIRILCVREFQTSIKESFHAELKAAIDSYDFLKDHYNVGVDYLRGSNGTEFIFRGLHRNTSAVKSLANIDLTIIEEAEDVPEQAWLDLEATIFRQPKSECWVIWNPRTKESPVDKRFRIKPPKDLAIAEVNWYDNPFFPTGLEKLRKREQERLDPNTYSHIWEGAYLENSNAQVLHGKIEIKEFKSSDHWDGPYYGMDFGFSQDPTTVVRCWVFNDNLYIDYDAGKVGLELDDTTEFFIKKIPDIVNHTIRADSARPESISHLNNKGKLNVRPVKKWAGSVEDGISHLRSYKKIFIHPRCEETIKETRLYSYKVDRLTGDILPQIIDANNHCFSGDTEVIVNDKLMRFDEIPKTGFIRGYDGSNKFYYNGGVVRCDKLLDLILDDDTIISVTEDHEFLTKDGQWVQAKDLKGQLLCKSMLFQGQNRNLMEEYTQNMKEKNTTHLGLITDATEYIEKYGNIITEKYQKDSIFITEIIMRIIMRLKILLYSQLANISHIIQNYIMQTIRTLQELILLRIKTNAESGINQMMATNGISNIIKNTKTNYLPGNTEIASNAEKHFMPKSIKPMYFAQTNVNPNGEGIQESMTLKKHVSSVAKYLNQINTPKKYIAVKDVQQKGMQEKETYCVTVPGDGCFSLANGVVVSNCIDALRYSLEPIIRNSTDVFVG